MEYNNLKSIGKIRDFDGEAGTIITTDKEFLFNRQQIKQLENSNNEGFVSFYPSTVKFGNEIYNVAREIESLSKDDIKSLKK
jgi:predicted xylose isomerase-like sugar epimerase